MSATNNNDARIREWNGRERAPLTFRMLVLQQLAACGCGGLDALSAHRSFFNLDQTDLVREQV